MFQELNNNVGQKALYLKEEVAISEELFMVSTVYYMHCICTWTSSADLLFRIILFYLSTIPCFAFCSIFVLKEKLLIAK